MQRSLRTRFAAASLAVVATLALAACGDDDDDTSDTSGTEATVSTVETTDGPDTTSETEDTTGDTTSDTTDGTTGDTTEGTGGGEVGEREDYVAAAEAQLEDIEMEDPSCIAEAVISEDIYAAIQDAGLTVEEFETSGPGDLEVDDATLDAAAEELAACEGLSAGMSDNDDQQACIDASFDNAELARLLTYTLFGQDVPEDLQAPNDEVEACYDALQSETTTS